MKAAFLGVFKGKYLKARSSKGPDSAVAEPEAGGEMLSTNGELGSLVDFNKKASAATIINKINNASAFSSSSSSTSSEKVVKSSSSKSSSSSSLLSKKAQVLHSSQELKQQQNELFQENRNFCRSVSSVSNSDSRLKLLNSSGSYEPLIEGEEGTLSQQQQQQLKFEQQRSSCSQKTKVSSSDGFTAEQVAATNLERKRLQTGGLSYEEKSSTAALKQKLETDGFSAEKMSAVRQDQMQLKTGDSVQQAQRTSMASSMKLATDDFMAEKVAVAKQEEKHLFSQGVVQAEKNVSSSSSAKLMFTSSKASGVSSSSKSSLSSQNLHQVDFGNMSSSLGMTSSLGMNSSLGMTFSAMDGFPFGAGHNKQSLDALTEGLDDDIRVLSSGEDSAAPDVSKAEQRLVHRMTVCVERLTSSTTSEECACLLSVATQLLRRSWAVPERGHGLGARLCDALRSGGGLAVAVDRGLAGDEELQLRGAELLEQALAHAECRAHVAEHGLERVVRAACVRGGGVGRARAGAGILERLFRHSEATCSDVVRLGGLQALLADCRKADVETLRHCATALANLALYGGPENQQAMIKHKVPVWLFPLAFHPDDHVKYYACLAISSLVANKEIEAAVLRSGTLNLVEPFLTSHSPAEFARSHAAHGQSRNWLLRLVAVLESKREEARSLAAFHFAMEAGIKKKQGNTQVFHEVGAVEALRRVASSPNAIASRYAAQALQLIGEAVPHKLSQQVPLWTVEDVKEWVKQIGFSAYTSEFFNSRVDGDLLLQLTEDMLNEDIGIKNGILRKRFLRELSQLKRMADYTSCDSTYLNHVLLALGPDFSQYTYQMLRCGVEKDTLRYISEEHLARDCGIDNSIHRLRIAHAIRGLTQESENSEEEDNNQKNLDVFVSYRRSNGSQLASLLKVHLQLRGFSVFLDVERLEAGKFDNNLLNSIRQAKNFLLVLTPEALERCSGDTECKDWVHKEIVEALQSDCNIIPILDNFQWPEAETLPEDMRALIYFNGVRWIHDYQDACVDKLERFMRGELNIRSDSLVGRYVTSGTPGTPGVTPGPPRSHIYQRSASNDSNKGSTCSDKEISSNNGSGHISEVSH